MAKARDTGGLCLEQEGTWQCPEGVGKEFPLSALQKVPLHSSWLTHDGFIPHAEFLKGVKMWHLGKKSA